MSLHPDPVSRSVAAASESPADGTRELLWDRMHAIASALGAFRYRFNSEAVLHQGMAAALTDASIAFEHEFVAGPKDRFDFWIDEGIVVECKIKGSFAQAAQQVSRYAERTDVTGIILASTRPWAGAIPEVIAGKPLLAIKLAVAF